MSSNNQPMHEREVRFNRIVARAFIIPLGVMVVASLLLAWLVSHLLTVTNWVDHTDKVIAQAENCERLVLHLETTMRGYLITGDPGLLKEFDTTGVSLASAFDALQTLVSDNSEQVERVKALRSDFDQWTAGARDLLDRRQRGADYQSLQINAGEMALMKKVNAKFAQFTDVETALRGGRYGTVQNIDRTINRSRLIVLLALGAGIGFYVRQQLRSVARLYEEALAIAEQKTRELQASEASLLEAQSKLRRHADDLEKAVASRTSELTETVGQLESYSYSVSHDLRAPLRAIRGYAQVIGEDFGPQLSADVRRYLERIMNSCNRMDALIQDILSYSKLTREELKFGPVDLDKLVHEIIQQYPALHAVDGQIKVESPLPRVVVPESLLLQCLSNLLNNAVKFTKDGVVPEVRVRTECHDSDVRIWVEDNGIGIDPQHQERIFGIFERVPGEKSYEGTGIGLAIVRKAAERMGGKAGVESQSGQGSRFWVDLPGRKLPS